MPIGDTVLSELRTRLLSSLLVLAATIAFSLALALSLTIALAHALVLNPALVRSLPRPGRFSVRSLCHKLNVW